jgi:hypothetical protein
MARSTLALAVTAIVCATAIVVVYLATGRDACPSGMTRIDRTCVIAPVANYVRCLDGMKLTDAVTEMRASVAGNPGDPQAQVLAARKIGDKYSPWAAAHAESAALQACRSLLGAAPPVSPAPDPR